MEASVKTLESVLLKQGILTQAQVNQVKLAMAQTGKALNS